MLKGFSPIINSNSYIIILGSFPGVQSLKKQEYYGHPRNQFWRLVYTLFDKEVDNDYNKKKKFLLSRRIALWDVIDSCKRKGSLDSNIKDYAANQLNQLFIDYPNIKHIFFNGFKAEKVFNKTVDFDILKDKAFTRLPSSSPARTMRFEEKLNQWKIIRESLKI